MIESIIQRNRDYINQDLEYFRKYINGSNRFTYSKRLRFRMLLVLILRLLRRSLQIELFSFYEELGDLSNQIHKSYLCRIRRFLSPLLFKDLGYCQIRWYEQSYGLQTDKHQNRRIIAVDGSTAFLPQKRELAKRYGVVINQYGQRVLGRIVIAHDVLNDLIIKSELAGYNGTSEVRMVEGWEKDYPKGSILLYDRHYPSYVFMQDHIQAGQYFIMRCRKNLNKDLKKFIDSGATEKWVELKRTEAARKVLKRRGQKTSVHDKIKVRLIALVIKGEPAYLITNLTENQGYSKKEVETLFHKRWGVETCYDALKNKMQIEIFSGEKPCIIEQDFHATIALYNLISSFCKEIEIRGNETRNSNSENGNESPKKYNYKANRNLLTGLVSSNLPKLLLKKNYESILKHIVDTAFRCREPDRPGRSVERNFRTRKLEGKYAYCSNYKRAI